jgi:2-dehydropantoate 2-reductase
MTIVVLGPGGVGGLLAGALERSGESVGVVAREPTAAAIAARGLRVHSATLGSFAASPVAVSSWREPIETLIVATKASGLPVALERIRAQPRIVLPLLNGLDHLGALRERFARETVVAGTIRVEAERPEQGVVVHTSPVLRVEMASAWVSALVPMKALAQRLERAGLDAHVLEPPSADAEAQVMWSKLVRLAPLACVTSAHDLSLGGIRADPRLRAELVSAIEESCAVASAEGAEIDPAAPIAELDQAHASLRSSMQRDLRAGRAPELDAIAGAVLRAAARHGLACPTIERLSQTIALRAAGSLSDSGDPGSRSRPVTPAG